MNESLAELILYPIAFIGLAVIFAWGVVPAAQQPRR